MSDRTKSIYLTLASFALYILAPIFYLKSPGLNEIAFAMVFVAVILAGSSNAIIQGSNKNSPKTIHYWINKFLFAAPVIIVLGGVLLAFLFLVVFSSQF